MTTHENRLCQMADRIIHEVLEEGKGQGHAPDDFVPLDAAAHMGRAARHLLSASLMHEGHIPDDAEGSEGHLRNALVRTAMALYVLRSKKVLAFERKISENNT